MNTARRSSTLALPKMDLVLAVGMPAHAELTGHDAATGQLLVFATDNLYRPLFNMQAGEHPAHVVTNGEGRRAFVTGLGTDRIMEFALQERREIPSDGTVRYRLISGGRSLYVANMRNDSLREPRVSR